MKKTFVLFCCIWITGLPLLHAQLDTLTVEKIMHDPKWIGSSPSAPKWSADGDRLYFLWNPDGRPADSLYAFDVKANTIEQVQASAKPNILYADHLVYNQKRTQYVYAIDGDVFWVDTKSKKGVQVTRTVQPAHTPVFSFGDTRVVYQQGDNLYAWTIANGATEQLIQVQKGNRKSEEGKKNLQEHWLEKDQLNLLEVIRQRKEKKEAAEAYDKTQRKEKLKTVYIGDKNTRQVKISADGRFMSLLLFKPDTEGKRTSIPDYVTLSGFTEDINGRTKVGAPPALNELMLYDRQRDTAYPVATDALPGIEDLPDYLKDYPDRQKTDVKRLVNVQAVEWSPGSSRAVLTIRARDNKDRWLMLLEAETGALSLLDRQRDEAWIGGPGMMAGGWTDEETYWFFSEASGYAHLYLVNTRTGAQKALTSGNYEVQKAVLSNDRKSFYITTNQVHPGEKQCYRLSIATGKQYRLTEGEGAHEIFISPDEKKIAILYSYSNAPAELFIQDNRSGSKPRRVTFKGQSDEFKSYTWRVPDLITFKAGDGQNVYARLYKPANPHPSRPAVIFVHGAGYLQNAHKWWSAYFREYMFHHLLADNGYYVLDIDYRGSAGYGRDWRTGIYRHMGGKDLTDHIDGAKYLVDTFGVDPGRIGIYGGSYGGFITLMALFTSPGTFAAGAALRPVTDWAHYNHGYTSNILNTPLEDSIAYRRSSPVYHAEGLQDELLICHGVVDVNVHFQDVVRLAQRLIELGKDNWEVAMYPTEDHGFVEPSSWTDEYKRIFKLFERVLKK